MKVHSTNMKEVERLIEIRARIISSGIRLLPVDKIEREVASRRGERVRLAK